MATHTVLVLMQRPDGTFWHPGQTVDYDGKPDWKLEPIEAKARAEWEETTAQPERVENEGRRNNTLEEAPPAGTYLGSQTQKFEPSGWRA